jgi:hypothetical protein
MSLTVPGIATESGVGEGAVSRAARDGDFVQGVAAEGGRLENTTHCYNQVCIGIRIEHSGLGRVRKI